MLKLTIAAVTFMAAFVLNGTPQANATEGEDGIVLREVASEVSGYCHIKYMAFKENTLGYPQPEFDPDDVVDFYGPCSFNPLAKDEIQRQIAAARRFSLDGEGDSGGGDGGGD